MREREREREREANRQRELRERKREKMGWLQAHWRRKEALIMRDKERENDWLGSPILELIY